MTKKSYDLILTRPIQRAHGFASDLSPEVAQYLRVHIAPLLAIRALSDAPDLSSYRGVIFSSASALDYVSTRSGLPAFCVGKRTQDAARRAGFKADLSSETADKLVEALIALQPATPLLHLHGAHTRGDIANRLNSAGIETISNAIYTQDEVLLPHDILDLLHGGHPCIVPLFSPRTAALFATQVKTVSGNVHVIALSHAVAEVIPCDWVVSLRIAKTPTADAMYAEIAQIIAG